MKFIVAVFFLTVVAIVSSKNKHKKVVTSAPADNEQFDQDLSCDTCLNILFYSPENVHSVSTSCKNIKSEKNRLACDSFVSAHGAEAVRSASAKERPSVFCSRTLGYECHSLLFD